MSAVSFGIKAPGEIVRYGLDWSPDLVDGDTVLTSEWEIPPGLTSAHETVTDGKICSLVLAGGNLGDHYTLKNTVYTVGNPAEKLEQSVNIWIGVR